MRMRWTACVAAAALGAAGAAAAEPAAPPNVLLIVSDDQGYGDFGFNGNPRVRTPTLDRLASESAVFRNFVVAPACSPTRAALWTGRDHLLTGVWGVPPRANLRPDEVRMPAFFRAAGYRTLHVGKLDCVKAGTRGPTDFGWDEWMGGGAYEHRDPMVYETGRNRRETGWTVDLWTDRAIRFIRDRRGTPWFASVAYIVPHLPWVCDETFSAPFVAQGCSSNLAACYGAIAQMDAAIGRLLDALRETGQADRTIVAFLSDNGATGPEVKQGSDGGIVRGADWECRNVAGLRGHKATVWENGIRVPFVVRWPGVVAPGDRTVFGRAEDVLPTLLELAGIRGVMKGEAGGPAPGITGVSLVPALRDPAVAPDRPAAFRMAIAGPGSPRDRIADPAARAFNDHHLVLRGPRFKYHALPGGGGALYDLDADPGETADVAAKHAGVAAAMAAECRARWDAVIAGGRAFAPPEDGAKKDPRPPAPAGRGASAPAAAGPAGTAAEVFEGPLSTDWFWGLGTWTASNGVLRGFESGPRRHGPVKMRRFPMRDGAVDFEFRLIGKASFAGIIFNGSQERGHLVHLVLEKERIRVLAHPSKGESVEVLKQPRALAAGEWHHVRVELKGAVLSATVDGASVEARHDCIAEEKLTFGLGGDSGGPEGESAGALEFRNLTMAARPAP